MGRSRFPPAKTEWRIARWSCSGQASGPGSRRSSAASTSLRRAARYAAMPSAASVSVVILCVRLTPRLERLRLPFLGRLLQDDLDGLLDLGELPVAEARELHAFLEERELALEPPVLPFELGDDRLEAGHGLLEAGVLLRAARHDSSSGSAKRGPGSSQRPPSRTMTPSSPWWSRTRMRSPTATLSAVR